MNVYSCKYCSYQSDRLYNLNVHLRNHSNSAQKVAASNPHPYLHPYLNNNNQQSNTYPQRTSEMVANNIYYATGTRAPTVMGIGPNGSRAPTTVYTPPLTGGVQQGGSALGPTTSINKRIWYRRSI